jgi:hypothetical protein
MAVQRGAGALGNVTGKVGTVVMCRWRVLWIMKSSPSKITEAKVTVKQIENRALFKATMNFFSIVSANNKLFDAFQLKPKEKITKVNAAISYHLTHAIVGEYPDYAIDLSKLRFSRALRSTENGYRAKFTIEGLQAKITWQLNPYREKNTQLSDRAVLFFYFSVENVDEVIIKHDDGAQRSALSSERRFPKSLIGAQLHCWIYFRSEDGKLVSDTEYLGALTVTG